MRVNLIKALTMKRTYKLKRYDTLVIADMSKSKLDKYINLMRKQRVRKQNFLTIPLYRNARGYKGDEKQFLIDHMNLKNRKMSARQIQKMFEMKFGKPGCSRQHMYEFFYGKCLELRNMEPDLKVHIVLTEQAVMQGELYRYLDV